MPGLNLDKLRQAMLRGGVAPRYVQRTVDELQQHFHDLEHKALADGADRHEARQLARQRLGCNQVLLDNIMSKDELKSWSARFPKFVYLFSPIMALIFVVAFSVIAAVALLDSGLFAVQGGNSNQAWFEPAIKLLFGFNEYLLTPALAVGYYLTARSRLTHMSWPFAGIIVLAFIGSGWNMSVDFPSAASEAGALHLTWGYAFLGIPVPESHTTGAVLRLALTLGIVFMASMIFRTTIRSQPAF